jgi:beta-glucanase (GH16 family)
MLDLSGYRAVFSDEFDVPSSIPSAETWKTTYYWGDRTLSGNGEQEFYVDPGYKNLGLNPFGIQDGVLTITAEKAPDALRPEINNLSYTSGLISSEQAFSMQYGYFEIRAQLPAGKGLWPAFWMLPIDGSWPPELDIMEVLGQDPTQLVVTAHSNATGSHTKTGTAVRVADTSAGFHTYGVDWGPATIAWYFDGQKVFEAPTPADMHQPMYMIANLAVGGSWPGAPDPSLTTATMKIDSIRAYERPLDHTPAPLPASWAPIPLTAFSTLDGAGATQTWAWRQVMGPTDVKLQLMGDWSRVALGNDLDNFIAGSNAQYNELNGGKGNDVLRGNGGIDVFVIKKGEGNDTILDLSNTPGNTDKIRLEGFHFSHFEDVRPWLTKLGADTLLRLDENQALLLKNISPDTLKPEQFAFSNPKPIR